MTYFLSLKDYCRIRYSLGDGAEPTKAQMNTVSQMCRKGKLDAFKSGRAWIVRLEDGK